MIDLHTGEINALFLENLDLSTGQLRGRMRVRHDGHAGLAVCTRYGTCHHLQRARDAVDVGRTLQEGRLNVGTAEPFGQITHKFARHLVGAHAMHETRHIQPPASDVQNVDAGAFGDGGQQRRVPPQIEGGAIDNGVDASGLGFFQRLDALGLGALAQQVGIGLIQAAGRHHHMLVHESEAQLIRADRAQYGVHGGGGHLSVP